MFNWQLVGAFGTLLGVVCMATVGQGAVVQPLIPRWQSPERLAAAQCAPQSTPPRIARLEQWLEAVNDHEAGAWDASAQTVGSWATTELESLFPYVKALVELVGQGEIKPGWVFSGVEVTGAPMPAPDMITPDVAF